MPNEKFDIVARAEDEAAEPKLRRVGANQIVAPYVIGGHRVVRAVLRPTLGHFLDRAGRNDDEGYQLEEIAVAAGSPLCGRTLAEATLNHRFGVVVLTMKRPNGEML